MSLSQFWNCPLQTAFVFRQFVPASRPEQLADPVHICISSTVPHNPKGLHSWSRCISDSCPILLSGSKKALRRAVTGTGGYRAQQTAEEELHLIADTEISTKFILFSIWAADNCLSIPHIESSLLPLSPAQSDAWRLQRPLREFWRFHCKESVLRKV